MTTNETLRYEYTAHMHPHVHAEVIRVLRDTVKLLEYSTDSALDEYSNELCSILNADDCETLHYPFPEGDVGVRNSRTEIAQYAAIRDNLSQLDRDILDMCPDVWAIVDSGPEDPTFFERVVYGILVDIAVVIHERTKTA